MISQVLHMLKILWHTSVAFTAPHYSQFLRNFVISVIFSLSTLFPQKHSQQLDDQTEQ